MHDHGVCLEMLYQARRRIAGEAVRTPLVRSAALSARFAADILLKLETCQPTGAFKLRGAVNMLAALIEGRGREGLASGVVTASTGNHGRAARRLVPRRAGGGLPVAAGAGQQGRRHRGAGR